MTYLLPPKLGKNMKFAGTPNSHWSRNPEYVNEALTLWWRLPSYIIHIFVGQKWPFYVLVPTIGVAAYPYTSPIRPAL